MASGPRDLAAFLASCGPQSVTGDPFWPLARLSALLHYCQPSPMSPSLLSHPCSPGPSQFHTANSTLSWSLQCCLIHRMLTSPDPESTSTSATHLPCPSQVPALLYPLQGSPPCSWLGPAWSQVQPGSGVLTEHGVTPSASVSSHNRRSPCLIPFHLAPLILSLASVTPWTSFACSGSRST